jgi:anti-sigma B factor antagonist
VTTTGDFDVRVTIAPSGTTIVHVSGELDPASAPMLEEAIAALEVPPRLVVDLTECSFLDSSGMRVLVDVRQSAPDTTIELVAADPAIVRALQIARLDTMFGLHSSLDDALDG